MSQTGSVWCRTCLQHAQEPGERGRHPCRWQHWKKIFRHLERRQDKQVAGIRNGTGFDHDAYFDATTGKFSSCVLTRSSDAGWITKATPLSAEEADLVTYFRTLTWPTSPQPLRCELQVRCSRHSSLVLSSTTLREEEIMELNFYPVEVKSCVRWYQLPNHAAHLLRVRHLDVRGSARQDDG